MTGIGRYAREIATGLAQSVEVEAEFMYGVRWSRSIPAFGRRSPDRLLPLLRDRMPGAYLARRWAQTVSLAQRQMRRRFDIYHEPAVLALPYHGPTVLTVHDISWIRFPQTQPPSRVRALDRHFESGLRHASKILTPSEFVRQELLTTFSLPPNKVMVTQLAADPGYRPRSAQETATVLDRFGLQHGQYLLAVGTLEPRKNLDTALEAYQQLPRAIRRHYPLVIVGMKGWRSSHLQRQLDSLIRSREVLHLGYLTQADLQAVTAGAKTLIFPSVYEGFGLPPLEAMACGVPPLVSNAASLPEVVGNAGLQVAPHDIDGLTQSIRFLLEDETVWLRLSQAGIARAKLFDWGSCVQQTLAAYRQVVSQY
ncbi:MAG: glycosyltransferase family 1 protein [Xylophilus ampelinus]